MDIIIMITSLIPMALLLGGGVIVVLEELKDKMKISTEVAKWISYISSAGLGMWYVIANSKSVAEIIVMAALTWFAANGGYDILNRKK